MLPDVFSAIVIAFAFFTVIPVPVLDWSGRRMRFVPLMMPLVGLVCGLGAFGLYTVLNLADMTPFLKAVLLVLYFILFSGGLHMDGLMDTADAYFSRRDRERKLEIMKDSNVGAFAVITLFSVMLLKVAVVAELFSKGIHFGRIMIFVPVLSRLLQSFMLHTFPSAKADGLTNIFGVLSKKNVILLLMLFILACAAMAAGAGVKVLLMPFTAVVYLALFYVTSKRQFGGITGDLLGAFLEISELLMFCSLLLVGEAS